MLGRDGTDSGGERRIAIRHEHRPGDIGWVIERHAVRYHQEYGWGVAFEALVATVAADFASAHDPTRDRCWIAELAGERVGCVFLVRQSETTAKLRLLLVEPTARGLGVGGQLVDTCLAFARQAGYDTVSLWTNDVLVAARRLYTRAGFRLIESTPHRDFGPEMVGEIWERTL
jgi:GNAT superfamily N-acetyltransferase